jgi:hypothetical protein
VSGPLVSSGIQKPAFDALVGDVVDLGIAPNGNWAAGTVSGTYIMSPAGGAAGVGAASTGVYSFPLDPALYAAPAGKALKLRLLAWPITNAVAPAVTWTFGLYPVATWGGASTANPTIASVGTVVSGSTVAWTTPAAGGGATPVAATFAFPAAGFYVVGVVQSGGSTAAGAVTALRTAVQRVFA